jgi:hypothetical protein
MSTFVKGGGTSTPFGRNEYLRSTKKFLTESYTVAAASVPAQTIDGNAGQKILQPGTVMAKITSGGDAGKVGPFSESATDGRQTPANIVGINDTFLPWQLIERDVEISVVYEASVVQAWCFEYTTAGGAVPQPLGNTTANNAVFRGKKLQISFS